MKLIFFYLLIFSNALFSQNLENLKRQDTVYFYFGYGKFEKKSISGVFNNIKKPDTLYTYTYMKEWPKTIKLHRQIYLSFDDIENDSKADIKILKKNFLRKNKKQIITIDFMLKYGFRETFYSIWQHSKVYLIDAKESSRGKIIARQVILNGEPYMSE